jgi:hypothetical protein
MGYEAKKTEHSGPKRGNGAYWGYKWQAKKESNRIRRENAKREVRYVNAMEDESLASRTGEA